MNELRMTPAALGALLDGDLDNLHVALTPGGIEAQEAGGQRDFVMSEVLPKECNFCDRKQLEQMGIVFGEESDDLFINVQLPDGWKKIPTDHSMWSKLVDEQGRERARIFYKAAFYDRKAYISLSRRFSYRVRPVSDNNANFDTVSRVGIVMDCEEEIWHTDAIEPSDELKSYRVRDILYAACQEWLEERRPEYENPLAYWD